MKKIRFRWVFLGVILIPTLVNSIYWTYSDWIQPRKAAKLAECVRKEFRRATLEKLAVDDRDAHVAEACAAYSPSQALYVAKTGPQFVALTDRTYGLVTVWRGTNSDGSLKVNAITHYVYYPIFGFEY